MKRWSIVYGDGAMDDILAITDFIARDSAINADKALDRLERRIATLASLPTRGRIVPELQWHGITTIREILEKPWRILYQIRAQDVVIVAVYDGRRHLNDVLMERFLRP
jgi:plasmid stabilization system protein ParE